MRKFTASVCLWGLLHSWALPVWGQMPPIGAVPSAINMMRQVGNAAMQAQQNPPSGPPGQMMNNNYLAQTIGAKLIPPDRLKYALFANCLIPDEQSITPTQECREGLGLPLPALEQNQVHAEHSKLFFERMLSLAKNERAGESESTSGLQCLEDTLKKAGEQLDQQFEGQMNELKTTQDYLQEQITGFKAQLEELRRRMEDKHAILNGDPAHDEKARRNVADLSRLVDSSGPCGEMLGGEAFRSAQKNGGLKGLRSGLEEMKGQAESYLGEREAIEKQFDDRLEAVGNDINSIGVDGWRSRTDDTTPVDASFAIAGFEAIREKALAQFDEKKAGLLQRLEKFGYPEAAPETDGDFLNGIQDAREQIRLSRHRGIQRCVEQENPDHKFGNIQSLWQEIGQRNVRGRQTGTLQNFRGELTSILSDTQSYFTSDINTIDPSNKMARIQALAAKYGAGTITVDRMVNGKRESLDISHLIGQMVLQCVNTYDTAPSAVEGPYARLSLRAKDEMAQGLLSEYEELVNAFPGDIISSMRKTIKSCNDIESSKRSCSSESFSPANPAFCFARADNCSEGAVKCHEDLEEAITRETQALSVLADGYNANIDLFIKKQNAALEQFKQSAVGLLGGDFSFPEDLMIESIIPSESELGVLLAGGDNLDVVLGLFPEKLDRFMETFSEEHRRKKEKYMAEHQEYIDRQRIHMEEKKAQWTAIAQSCGQAVQAQREAMGQAQQQQMQGIGRATSKDGPILPKVWASSRDAQPDGRL